MNTIIKITSILTFIVSLNILLLQFVSWAISVPEMESQGKTNEYLNGYRKGKSQGINLIIGQIYYPSLLIVALSGFTTLSLFISIKNNRITNRCTGP